MRAFAALFFALSSAFAYQVTYPTETQGWSTSGTNLLEWTRVDTDPTTFAAVLKNDHDSSYVQILDSSVDGTTGSIYLSPPSGGWPTTGTAYRINIAQDAQHLDTLLAQSPQFNFTGDSSGGTSGSPPGSSGFPGSTSSGTGTSSRPPTSTQSGSISTGSSTGSSIGTTPTSTSAGFIAADIRVGLLTAVTALTAFFTTVF